MAGAQEEMPADELPETKVRPWSNWQLGAVLVHSLRSMILGCWTWRQIQQQLQHLKHLLTSPQQEDRVQQESAILQQLDAILAALPAVGGSLG